jgi:ABC transport system ATP-binding/permease protein
MPLISLHDVRLAFGGPPLLDGSSFQLEKGERVGLLGRNGEGKSTLLALLAGEREPDAGRVDRARGLRVARLAQDVPRDLSGTVLDVVTERAGEPAPPPHRVAQILSRLGLEAGAAVSTLSGGLVRRVLLARALSFEPDVLLLDEPTNHLDIASIQWLEGFLASEDLTLVFVTHDRAFLRRLATRIVELDRGRLFDFTCDYDTFVARKDALLDADAAAEARFDKRLAKEEAWIRTGIKARRTRNEGRVRALERMREERRKRRERQGTAKMRLIEADRSGKIVAEVTDLSFAYDAVPIVRDLSTTVQRGDRIGVIGPNGAGKTTLLKLLLGDLKPDAGEVRLGTNLQILYFDQMREALDPEKSVRWNLAGEHDTVQVGGRSQHVISYLQDFLFTPDRAHGPVRVLSGGERNRLLLARLFTRPANVLILDEPTNDLDLETLDLLESLLADFDGTVFVVSHDRDFLDRVVTSTLVFEGEGRVTEYVGGYADWLRQRPAAQPAPDASADRPRAKARRPQQEKPRKLSFKERRELEAMPERIEILESEQAALHARMADPSFYKEAGEEVAATQARLDAIEDELEAAYARWGELDAVEDA